MRKKERKKEKQRNKQKRMKNEWNINKQIMVTV